MIQYDPFHALSDSEEALIADALAELLISQRKAIKECEAIEAAQTDPVRRSADSRITGSRIDRQRRIEALISKLFA